MEKRLAAFETNHEQHGRPYPPVLAKAIVAFRQAPEWGGVLAFKEFGLGTVVLRPTPWGIVPKGEWTDHEDRLAAEWLQRQGILVSVDLAGQAVQTAAKDYPFHSVRTYLNSLQLDGIERVDRWLPTYRRGYVGVFNDDGAEDQAADAVRP